MSFDITVRVEFSPALISALERMLGDHEVRPHHYHQSAPVGKPDKAAQVPEPDRGPGPTTPEGPSLRASGPAASGPAASGPAASGPAASGPAASGPVGQPVKAAAAPDKPAPRPRGRPRKVTANPLPTAEPFPPSADSPADDSLQLPERNEVWASAKLAASVSKEHNLAIREMARATGASRLSDISDEYLPAFFEATERLNAGDELNEVVQDFTKRVNA